MSTRPYIVYFTKVQEMKKIHFVLFMILLYIHIGYSQEKESYHLELAFTGMIKNYKIAYKKSDNNGMLVVSKAAPNMNFSRKDSLKLLQVLKSKDPGMREQLAKLMEDNTKYNRDTLFIRSSDSLATTVDHFVNNWKNLKKELELNPDKRIILDGHTVKLSLQENSREYEEIYVSAPTAESHPVIFQLISTLEAYYKKETLDPLIN